MKTKVYPYALIISMIALSAIFVIQGCKKSVSPFDPSNATYVYSYSGQVVDAQTNLGIPSATVKILNKVVTADANGYFSFKVSYATSFPFTIYGESPNYTPGNSMISGPAQVRAIRLSTENPGVIVDQTGGKLVATSNESVTGKSHELTIPAGALSQPVSISFTSMEEFFFTYASGNSNGTSDLVDLATLSIAPYAQTFQKPVSVYIPLPFYNDTDTQFPVYRYEPTTHSWINTGKVLTVDGSGSGGNVELTQGGIYSVADAGTFTEELVNQSYITEYSCDGESTLSWQAMLDHPQSLPANVSETWLKNTVSHYTVLGGHASFLKKTVTSVSCNPYQPGSSYPIPGDEITISGNPYPCPSGTNPHFLNRGVSINKRVINTSLTFTTYSSGANTTQVSGTATVQVPIQSYEYWCPHDQGGGK